ncbi:MAG: hypothetical protein IKV71_00345, partial [Psychrobacter sp.]|nr:hypothetical protein [Psychrobacter sp.]
MGHNHRLNQATDTHTDNVDSLDSSNGLENSESLQAKTDRLDKSSSADNKWQDGLRRDENDKV